MKRYIYIILGVIVVIVVALLLWWLFSRNSSPAATGTNTTGTLPSVTNQTGQSGASAGTANGQTGTGNEIQVLSGIQISGSSPAATLSITASDPTFDYFVDSSTNVFAVEPDGKISETSNGQVNYLSSTEVAGLIDAGFSYDGTKAIVNFGTVSSPQTSLFNIASTTWTPLPQGFISPQWSPGDYRIAYLEEGGAGVESLFTLDLSKPTNKPIVQLTLNANDLDLQWLNKNQIVLFDRPSAYVNGSAWLFDIPNKTLTPIVSVLAGFEAAWSESTGTTPQMGLAFYTGSSAQGGLLELINPAGSVIQNLTFLTLPSKCLFASMPVATSTALTTASSSSPAATSTPQAAGATSTLDLYCAVPRDSSELSGSVLPDSYDQMSLLTSDNFYKIDTGSGNVSALFTDQTQNIDATDLRIFNGNLFFINRYDEKLYSLSLAQ